MYIFGHFESLSTPFRACFKRGTIVRKNDINKLDGPEKGNWYASCKNVTLYKNAKSPWSQVSGTEEAIREYKLYMA